MNENNNRNNNDERLNSSLSSSAKERAMESEGEQLQAARERQASMPKNLSSNGNVSPRGGGLPSKNNINSGNRNAMSGKNGANSGARGNAPSGSSNGGGLPSRGGINSGAQGLKNKVASKGLQAMGVPKKLSDSAVNSKLGKKALGMLHNPAGAALNGIKNGLKNAGKSEAEKDAFEKEEEEQEKEKRSGFVTLRVPLKVKLILLLAVLPSFSFVILFLSVVVAYVGDENVFNLYTGKMFGKMDAETADGLIEMHNGVNGKGGLELGMGASSYNTYNEFESRMENIGNIFEIFDCESEEECRNRDEVKFYIKVNDISNRYKNKYHITLDWELLMATALSMDLDVKEMFVAFYNEYNEDDVENYDILMNLDWDYDYKKISGYSYLDQDNFQYDLQILAKNMVTKTTTQTCSKTVNNADGTTSVEVTKTQTDMDIEEQYFKSGEEYHLQCSAGETYDISSNYRLDLEKYDDFLLEYIEHKKYIVSAGVDPVTGETDMTPSEATGEYIWPLPSGATRCRSSAYGYRIHPITGESHYHSGDDYPAAAGTPVYAVADGTVAEAGYHSSMGNYIKINHAGGLQSTYMHSSQLYVSKGDIVKQGDVIMAVGTTGSSTGNHLHITFKLNGTLVSPGDYIGALGMCS